MHSRKIIILASQVRKLRHTEVKWLAKVSGDILYLPAGNGWNGEGTLPLYSTKKSLCEEKQWMSTQGLRVLPGWDSSVGHRGSAHGGGAQWPSFQGAGG